MADTNTSRCDLAIEAHEMLAMGKASDFSINGIKVEETEHNNYIKITRIKVDNENGARELGKPMGSYITIEMPARFYGQQEIYEEMCKACACELKSITDEMLDDQDDTVLVVGLGNDRITADALGPRVIDSLMITRHLKKYIPDEIDEGIRPLCAIAPGVLGTTGMETEEIVRSLAHEINPKLVIVIDALCSGSVERINTTVQLTDTGITPGGGVGNKRKTINAETLGRPVIAIGVPTVVDAATIAAAGMDIVMNKRNDINIPRDEANRRDWIRSEIGEELGSMIVAPKDVDSIIGDIASVIANGINISMHEGITLADVDRYK
ncbi:MAG: GPR endopeptidase [Clostridiales bacterium]|nr:GPR endopeptidase [Clostridiales bacterium]